MASTAFKNPYVIGGALIVAAFAYVLIRGAGKAGQDVGGGAVRLAEGVAVGSVVGVADVLGIPPTNMTACEKAITEGRTLDASVFCPAKTFIKSLF